jgi:hypothetical protein
LEKHMATATDTKVEFSGKVDLSDYKEFSEYFDDGKGKPIYGATTWFISTSLKTFLAEARKNPKLKDQVIAGIQAMLENNRAET